MRGLFVTGTDTGVGKTILTAGLALALRARGHDCGVAKPVQSGAPAADPDGDAMILRRLVGLDDPVDELAPFSFSAPLAPLVAARLEGSRLELPEVVEAVRRVSERREAVIVEGAGGLLVPVGEDWTVADLAAALALPLLIVARAGLGTVNHTTLTVLAARQLGLATAGVVLNGAADESTSTNAELIARLAGVPVLGTTPRLDGELTPERVRALVEDNVTLAPLLEAALLPVGAGNEA